MKNNSAPDVFMEDIYKDKIFIGAAPVFDKCALSFKKNTVGILGVHAARPFRAGEIILSMENTGALSNFRAFDEVQEMLSILGPDKYFLPNNVITALAIYKRYFENAQTDALFATIDIEKSYQNTPMAALYRVEFQALVAPNYKQSRWSAEFLESSIHKMGLNFVFFFQCLAYVRSRAWDGGAGILIGFDAFNASHGGTANTIFKAFKNQFAFLADRDIQIGEEFTWNYNILSAWNTFTGYGYLDLKRMYQCPVELSIEPDELEPFVDIFTKCFSILSSKAKKSEMDFFNIYTYEFELTCPGPDSQGPMKINQIASATSSYAHLRRLVRVQLIQKEGLDYRLFSSNDSNAHISSYGAEFEARCIQTMLDVISQSKELFAERIKIFREGRLGPLCDIQPIEEIANYTYGVWEKCLSLTKQLMVAKSADEASLLISNHLGQPVDVNTLKSFLDHAASESPELTLTLAKEVLREKRFI